jgi:hypothetical protein
MPTFVSKSTTLVPNARASARVRTSSAGLGGAAAGEALAPMPRLRISGVLGNGEGAALVDIATAALGAGAGLIEAPARRATRSSAASD